MRSFFRFSRSDVLAFAIPALLYAVLIAVWSYVVALPDNNNYTLAFNKDIVFYGMWAAAGLFALVGTALELPKLGLTPGQRNRSMVLALLALAIPLGAAFIVEIFVAPWLIGFMRDNGLDIMIPLVQLGIAGLIIVLSIVPAVRSAGMPGQVVPRLYTRLGLGLIFIPLIGFIVDVFHPDWAGPSRGVSIFNAAFHGMVWSAYFVWLVGANLLEKPVLAKAGRR